MNFNKLIFKLIRNNKKQYTIFFISVIFALSMVSGYGILQFSSSVNSVIKDGGSTQMISLGMYCISIIALIIFLIYANAIFLQYQSRQIGIFLSLGIKKKEVKHLLFVEHSLIYIIASFIGILLSIPIAWVFWSTLNLFLKTSETGFHIGIPGIMIAIVFTILTWLLFTMINCIYIRRTNIIKLLKKEDSYENTGQITWFFMILWFLLIPLAIFGFFLFTNMYAPMKYLAYPCIVLGMAAVYHFILNLASYGDLLKQISKLAYLKNIVFLNVIKQKIHHYTRAIFVASLLIALTIFGLVFISAGMIDGYYKNLNDRYDYSFSVTNRQLYFGEQQICEIARETNTDITHFDTISGCMVAKMDEWKDGYKEWNYACIISEAQLHAVSNTDISVPEGTYTIYYKTGNISVINHSVSLDTTFYNPATKTEFHLTQNPAVSGNDIFSSFSVLDSYIVLNHNDYNSIIKTLGDEYKINTYSFCIYDWKTCKTFQKKLLSELLSITAGTVDDNWLWYPLHDLTDYGEPNYYSFSGNEYMAAREWPSYPKSKLSTLTESYENFAIYLLLMFFITIIVFVSAVMVMSLKLLGTVINDSPLYVKLEKIGMAQKNIIKILTKQVRFIYFIPTIVGGITGYFASYQIILASDIIYIGKTMQLATGILALVFIIQLLIYTFLLRKIKKIYFTTNIQQVM